MAKLLHQQLTKLRDFILTYNTYFDNGFDYVTQDGVTGYVANNEMQVFPADNFGNYFYLRLPNQLGFDYSELYKVSDCGGGVGVTYNIILVALVIDGDTEILVQNILTTLGNYNQNNIQMTKILIHAEDVISQELAKIDKSEIQSAVQRVPYNSSLCSVHFKFTVPYVYQSLSCIINPCSCS